MKEIHFLGREILSLKTNNLSFGNRPSQKNWLNKQTLSVRTLDAASFLFRCLV